MKNIPRYTNHCCTAAGIGSDPVTVHRIRNRWVQEGQMERRAGSQQPTITNSQKTMILLT